LLKSLEKIMTHTVSLDRDQAGSPEPEINCPFDAALVEGSHLFFDAMMARPSERRATTDPASGLIDFGRGICSPLSEIRN
jgi:hypothetical protein